MAPCEDSLSHSHTSRVSIEPRVFNRQRFSYTIYFIRSIMPSLIAHHTETKEREYGESVVIMFDSVSDSVCQVAFNYELLLHSLEIP